MSNQFYCKFCDITCTGKAPYDQHIQSAKHLKKAQLNQSCTSSEQSNSSPSSPSVTTTASRSLAATPDFTSDDNSISSPLFSISPETMRILLEWNHPQDHKPYCDICQLPLYGGDNVDIHFDLNNKLHNQKLAVWKQIQENDARYSCKVCSEIFSNEYQMREHFISDPHENMKQQKINLQKIIQIYETYQKLKQTRLNKKDFENVPSIEETLSNQFENLNVIDGTDVKSPVSPKPILFTPAKLAQVMKKQVFDDD